MHPDLSWAEYEDFTGDLFKLMQTTTVRDYQTQFEKLANRTRGLSDEIFKSCFISGLKEHIRAEVRMFKPKTMMQAVSLAILAEDKFIVEQRSSKLLKTQPPLLSRSKLPQTQSPPLSRSKLSQTQSPRLSRLAASPANKLPPIKRLPTEEMEARRAQDLCYNYDDKYSPSHKCMQQKLYLLDVGKPSIQESHDKDEDKKEETPPIQVEVMEDQLPEISVHALGGICTFQTIKVEGHFKGQCLIILIDLGSTHNFIDPQVAQRANYYIYSCNSFEVMVTNGEVLSCKGKCKNVKVWMGDYNLKTDMFALPLRGCDIVLGTQWLHSLGTIAWNFSELWIQFNQQGKQYTFRSMTTDTIQPITSHRREKLSKKSSQRAGGTIVCNPVPNYQ